MNEKPTNVYENLPNEEALKQQRAKYIKQELEWFGTNEGVLWLNWLEGVRENGGQEEAEQMEDEEVIDELVDKIRMRVYDKTVSDKKSQEEWEKFQKEFPVESIREQLINGGIISKDNRILVFDEDHSEE